MTQVGDTLRREISVMNDSVDHALTRAADLETRVNGQVAALERAHRDAEAYARTMTERLADQQRVVTEQSDGVRAAVETGRNYSQQAFDSVQTFIKDVDTRIETQVQELAAKLDRTLTRFQQGIETRTRSVDESLGAHAQDMIKGMSESGKDLAAALDRRVKDASVVIDSRSAEIEEAIGSKIDLLDSTLQHRLVSIAKTLDARVANLEDIAAGRAHEAATQIEIHAKATADALDNHLGQLIQALKINAAEASGLVETRSRAASETLLTRLQQIADAIDGRSAEARQTLGKTADELENRLTALSSNVTGALAENAQYVERTLLGASAEVARNVVGQSDHITVALRQHAGELTELLDTKSSALLQSLRQRSEEFSTEVTRATNNAVTLLDTQGSAFLRSVGDNGARIAHDIASASGAASDALNQSVRAAEDATRAALERSKQTTAASLAEMREVHGLLRTEGLSMFERLREANLLLREALGSSQDSMVLLEKKLAKRLAELVATMKTVSARSGTVTAELQSHIGSFQDSALKVLEDLSQLAAQFESHGHSLVQTVDLIDNINQRTVDTVNSRGAVLDTLVSTLDARASDFEARLMRFSGVLDESLENATARTRDIGLLVAEASSSGVRAITEQYDLVRNAVEQENNRTSDTLRNVYQTTVGEAQTTLQQTADRFTELLQGIKKMAADMQRELETTREELRRGVLDIPRETSDSMTQMRQVVIDQVEALAELHRIVAKHGRSTGVAESRHPLLEDHSAVRTERPRREAREVRDVREAAPPPVPPAPPRGDARSARGGWLSDLLHRASGDETAPSGAKGDGGNVIPSLDALSVDIARMIDHDSVGELWDRYNRGERNVFSRRLYTPQGQRAFDEIRVRYKNDRDFKHTVDRYMSEFERLMEEVSRDDRGQTMVRTYLTSETGKVYTMLAHASGRFD